MASAAFSVEGSTPPVAVAAAATVDLALLSVTGVRTVEWSIEGGSESGATSPTITPAGSPNGATATFTMSTPDEATIGIAWIVKCVINNGRDDAGQLVSAHTFRALVGVNGADGYLPFCYGETSERNATHGVAAEMNAKLAGVPPGGGASTNDPLTTALIVDAGTSVDPGDQDGSIGAPYDDIQTAIAALDEEATHAVWVAPGTYADALTLNSTSDLCEIDGPGIYTLGDVTITAGTLTLRKALIGGTVAVAASQVARLFDCTLSDGTACFSGAGAALLYQTTVDSPTIALGALEAYGCLAETLETITCSGTAIRLIDCKLDALTDITFSGSAGVATMDGQSFRTSANAGVVVTNGSIALVTQPGIGIASPLSGASNTLDISHSFQLVPVSHGSPTTVTIDSNANVKHPIGTIIGIKQTGAGQVTVAVTSDTLDLPTGMSALNTRVQKSVVWVQKTAATEWTFTGGDAEL